VVSISNSGLDPEDGTILTLDVGHYPGETDKNVTDFMSRAVLGTYFPELNYQAAKVLKASHKPVFIDFSGENDHKKMHDLGNLYFDDLILVTPG
jgi:hypothetical protein